MLPFDNRLNLLLSTDFPSSLIHWLNCGVGFPSALQCMMPDFPLIRVCWGLLAVNLAVQGKIDDSLYSHKK